MSFPFPGNQERQTAREMAEYLAAYVLELNQSFTSLHYRAWESDPQAVEAALQTAHQVAAQAVTAARQPEVAAPAPVERPVVQSQPQPESGNLASIRAVIDQNSKPAAATAQETNVFPLESMRQHYQGEDYEIAA